MNYKFINYGEFPEIENGVVYVSDSNSYLKTLQKRDLSFEKPLFLTMNEFKEKILLSNRIVLKEEKETILFYENLSKEDKKFFNIETYYDCVDISGEFYKFFNELNEYQVDISMIELKEEWEREVFFHFIKIRERLLKSLKKLNYSVRIERNINEYSDYYFKEYKKIVFFNILHFTNLEREIVHLIDKRIGVDSIIQGKSEDFDIDKMSIESYSLPEIESDKISIKSVPDSFIEIALIMEEESGEVITRDFDKFEYRKVLNRDLFKQGSISFENSRIYKFLSIIRELLEGQEIVDGVSTFNLKSFRSAIYEDVFSSYYGVGLKEKSYIESLVNDDYKLISSKIWEKREHIIELSEDNEIKKNEIVEKIVEELELFSTFKTIKEFTVYFGGEIFKIDKLKDDYVDMYGKYYEALSEVEAIEDLGIIGDINRYFETTSEGILRMILKYLRFKKVDIVCGEDFKYYFVDFDTVNYMPRENILISGLSEGVFPRKERERYLLNEEFRIKNGLMTLKKERLIEKYKFFNLIIDSKNVSLVGVENLDQNRGLSSYLEEISFYYGVAIERVDNFSYIDIDGRIFDSKELMEIQKNEDDSLKQNRVDKINLSYYSYEDLKKCPYMYYLKNRVKLEEMKELKDKIDKMYLGKVVHSFFEYIGRVKEEQLLKGDYSISEELLDSGMERAIYENSLKKPKKYRRYYEEIIYPIIRDSAKALYKELEKGYEQEKLLEVKQEYKISGTFMDVDGVELYSSGRIDLYIESDKSIGLIDYKSGKGKFRQLDFYEIMLKEKKRGVEKAIFAAIEKKVINKREKSDKELTLEEIEEVMSEFLKSGIYRRAEKVSSCTYCEYHKICKMRLGE